MSDNRGDRNRKQSDMSDGIKVLNSIKAVNPDPFLTGLLEASVVTLSFGSQSINLFKGYTISVN